jgi:hypothetical protein
MTRNHVKAWWQRAAGESMAGAASGGRKPAQLDRTCRAGSGAINGGTQLGDICGAEFCIALEEMPRRLLETTGPRGDEQVAAKVTGRLLPAAPGRVHGLPIAARADTVYMVKNSSEAWMKRGVGKNGQ